MGPFIKGMSIGVTVGAITYAMTTTSSNQKKRMKKNANKAVKIVGSVLDGISFMTK